MGVSVSGNLALRMTFEFGTSKLRRSACRPQLLLSRDLLSVGWCLPGLHRVPVVYECQMSHFRLEGCAYSEDLLGGHTGPPWNQDNF